MPFSVVTLRVWPGSSVRSSRRTRIEVVVGCQALARTVTLKNCRPPLVSQMIRLVSPGGLAVDHDLGGADRGGFGDIAQADGDARDGLRAVDQHGLAHGDGELVGGVLQLARAGCGGCGGLSPQARSRAEDQRTMR